MDAEDIKTAARKLFVSKGYEAATMREIAKLLNVTAASIYFHFKSKDELFLEIMKDCGELYSRYFKEVFSKISKLPALEIMSQYFRARVEFHQVYNEEDDFFIRAFMFPPSEIKLQVYEIVAEKNKKYENATAPVFKALKAEGVIKDYSEEVFSHSFYRFVNGYVMELTNFSMVPAEENLDIVWDLYLSGIKK